MHKLKVALVAYSNTLPFELGLNLPEYAKYFELKKFYPSQCLKIVKKGEADIGIVPVLGLFDSSLKRISNFCIATHRAVRTVKIFSNTPIEQAKKLYLDYQSATSNVLSQILCKFHFKCNPVFIPTHTAFDYKKCKKDAFVLIGDRVFEVEKSFQFEYDLGTCWYDFYQNPFVFAVWVTRGSLPKHQKALFDNALKTGVSRMEKTFNSVPNVELKTYLKQNICYELSKNHLQSMKKFLDLSKLI